MADDDLLTSDLDRHVADLRAAAINLTAGHPGDRDAQTAARLKEALAVAETLRDRLRGRPS